MSPLTMPRPSDRVRVRMFGRVYGATVLAVGRTRATVEFRTETGRHLTKTLPVLANGEWPRKNQACIWYDPPSPRSP